MYEREESQKVGKHLARFGIIAEPCWVVLGPFDSNNFDADFESRLLKAVFNVEQTVSLPVEQAASLLTKFPCLSYASPKVA